MHFFSDVVCIARRGVLVGVAGTLALSPLQAAVMGGTETAARSETEQGVAPLRTAPSALLTIDQHRSTVVERIVSEWALELAASSAGITTEELRTTLSAMRADDLLAASMAGSLDGLRKVVVSAAQRSGAPAGAKASGKALGDAADDLVYTPVVPCRIVDSRNVGGSFGGGETRGYHAYLTSGTFATQGGAASDCGIPANPAAVALNLTVVSAGSSGYLTAWPYNTTRPNASTLNYAPGQVVANGALIPLCQSCAADFSVYASGVDLIVDIVGYFATPVATALQCTQVASGATAIAVSADTLVALPSCATGYTRTGSNCSGTANVPGGYLLETNAAGCLFRNLSSVTTYNGTATSTCCRVPGR